MGEIALVCPPPTVSGHYEQYLPNTSNLLLNEPERPVIVLAITQLAIDKANKLDDSTQTQLAIRLAEDILVEHITQALLAHTKLRHKHIVAAQRRLVLQIHTRHHRVYTLLV